MPLLLLAAVWWVGASTVIAETAMPKPTIEEVQQQHSEAWLKLPGVEGTAIGLCNNAPCIKVLVSRRTPELTRTIPDTVEGYPVVIEVTGEFHAPPGE